MQTMTQPGTSDLGRECPSKEVRADRMTSYFVGGTVLNRPGLAAFGNTIVGGFGGHCDNFNYTGMLVAVSKTPGVGVTNIQAMEASPGKRARESPGNGRLSSPVQAVTDDVQVLHPRKPWISPSREVERPESGSQVWDSQPTRTTTGFSSSRGTFIKLISAPRPALTYF